MSVDGEIWTDLQKVPELIRLCGGRLNETAQSWCGRAEAVGAPTSDRGIVAMTIEASRRGEGCTRALRSLLSLRSPNLMVRPLSEFVASAIGKSENDRSAAEGTQGAPSTMPLRTDILCADYYSIATWHRSLVLPKRPGHLWVVAVDDVSAVRAFLAANGKLEPFCALVDALSSAGGVLVTTATSGTSSGLPREIASRVTLTLTYRIGSVSAAVHERMLREDEYWLPGAVGRVVAAECLKCASSGLDRSGGVSRGGFRLAVAVATNVLQCAEEGGGAPLSPVPRDLVHDAATVAVGAVSRLEPLRSRGGSDGSGLSASVAVRYEAQPETPLYGLDELKSRLVLLCQLHVARFGSRSVEASGAAEAAEVLLSAGGGVARKADACTGVLLRGPSGVGKTALLRSVARVLATSHGVPSLIVQGSQLYAKYLGESEGRLRHVFAQARRLRPCVVVIEDIDAIARSRRMTDHESASSGGGSSNHGGVDVTKRMLAALLCELDGVSGNDGVLVLATSSRPDDIDSALLRQGRLEVVLDVPPMNASALREMCKDFLTRLDERTGSTAEVEAGRIAALALEAGVRQANELQMAFRLVVESFDGERDDGGESGSIVTAPTDEIWKRVCAEVVRCRERGA